MKKTLVNKRRGVTHDATAKYEYASAVFILFPGPLFVLSGWVMARFATILYKSIT